MRPTKKAKTTTRLCTTQRCPHHLDPYDGHDRCFACLGERHFVECKEVQCQHCKSFSVSSYQNKQRRREKFMEEAGLPGTGATRWGSYRIPLRQGSLHSSSSDDESGRGTPDRPEAPVAIPSTTRDLQVKLALKGSPTKEGESPASPFRPDGRTAQPPPSLMGPCLT